MHASNVAILLLAASATVPVLAVPLPYVIAFSAVMTLLILNSNFNARSEDSGAALSKRDFDDSPKFMLRDDTHEQLATRDTGDDIMAAIVNTRGIDPQQAIQARNWLSELAGAMEEFVLRDVTPEELAARDGLNNLVKKYLNSRESGPDHLNDVPADKLSARDIVEDFMAAVANSRDFSPEQVIQARSSMSELATAVEDFVLRDATPDELAARDGLNDVVKRFLNSRDSGPNQARNWLSKLASAVEEFVLRDVTPDELAARDDLDDFMNTYFLNTRESVSQPDIQARSAPDGPSKTVARDTVADGFINALLKSRDSSGITPDDLLALASLASRTLNDLD
jgi:hypothetical protein